jgi:hypothetical protein
MPLATTFDNHVLDALFGSSFSVSGIPATVYIGLSSTTPTQAGTNITEPSGGNYARVAVANNSTNWPNASGAVKSNANQITFNTPNADWGAALTYWIMMDASTAGNLITFGALTNSVTVHNGDLGPFFSANALQITAA